ncbi:MAG: sugar ABC transporter permease, partial [Bacillota bacterium]
MLRTVRVNGECEVRFVWREPARRSCISVRAALRTPPARRGGALVKAARTQRNPWWKRPAFREAAAGYLFASPGIVGLLAFWAGPILVSLYFSFAVYNVFQPPVWVGARNYVALFTQDRLFWTALYNTLYFAAFNVPLSILIGLALTTVMNQKLRGIEIFRAVYFLPSILPGVAVALLWLWIFNPEGGLLNTWLAYVGIKGPGWLASTVWSKPAIILMSFWGLGGRMII